MRTLKCLRQYLSTAILTIMFAFSLTVPVQASADGQEEVAQLNERIAQLESQRTWTIGIAAGIVVLVVWAYFMGRKQLFLKLCRRNDELRNARDKAQEADKLKSAFIRNMSHEIRTPLNAVAGFTQLVCNPDIPLDETERADFMNRISTNVNLITAIINELLEISRTESLKSQYVKEDVFCNAMCQSAFTCIEGSQKEGVKIKFSTDIPDDFIISTNENSVQRVLSHLLGNAVKFTQKGFIELHCTFSDDRNSVEISVSDTGPGIPEYERKRVFENFYKGNDFIEGVGLGLPIALRLANGLGGTLTIDSKYVGGSRFILSLPIKERSTGKDERLSVSAQR